jgi:hypothetical protein
MKIMKMLKGKKTREKKLAGTILRNRFGAPEIWIYMLNYDTLMDNGLRI